MDRPLIEDQISALPADSLYEIVDGQVIIAPPMGALGCLFAAVLVHRLNSFAFPRKRGIALIEGLFQLRENKIERRPDVAFIPADRWPGNLRPDLDPPSLHIIPTLAVEIISPSITATEIEEKREEYFDAGVQAVWVVHPIKRTIHVWSTPDQCQVISAGGTLDGGTAIPGFQVKVDDLFAAMFPVQPNSVKGAP